MMSISRGQATAMETPGASLRVSFGGFRPRARAGLQSWRRAQVGVQQLLAAGGGAPKVAMRSWSQVGWHHCGSRGGGVRATTLMRRCRNFSGKGLSGRKGDRGNGETEDVVRGQVASMLSRPFLSMRPKLGLTPTARPCSHQPRRRPQVYYYQG